MVAASVYLSDHLISRSSRSQIFFKTDLKARSFIKKKTRTQMFSCKFAKFLRVPDFTKTALVTDFAFLYFALFSKLHSITEVAF